MFDVRFQVKLPRLITGVVGFHSAYVIFKISILRQKCSLYRLHINNTHFAE